jgi:hypothetical protein
MQKSEIIHADDGEPWGWMMEGCEVPFMWALEHAKGTTQADCLNYIEIGIAHCQTIAAVCRFLKPWTRFHAWGVEPPSDPFGCSERMRLAVGCELYWGETPAEYCDEVNTAQLCLLGSERWTEQLGHIAIHAAFIDGCHCEDHVRMDFLNLESRIVPGGVVMFHDTHPRQQGTHNPQTHHESRPLMVRYAMQWLGLLHHSEKPMSDGLECQRPGWRILFDYQDCPQGISAFQKLCTTTNQ